MWHNSLDSKLSEAILHLAWVYFYLLICFSLIAISSGSKVLDRRFICDHIKLNIIFKYNHYYSFLTTTALFMCKINFFKVYSICDKLLLSYTDILSCGLLPLDCCLWLVYLCFLGTNEGKCKFH